MDRSQQERSTTPLHLVSQAGRTSSADQLPRPNTVKPGLTPKRPRRQVENDEYSAFIRRILRAYAGRVGNGDVEALTLMLGVADEIDAAMAEAVKGLHSVAPPGLRSAPDLASPVRLRSNAGE